MNQKEHLSEEFLKEVQPKKAGIKTGDIILEFDGQKIKTMRNLPRVVANTKPNKKVSVKIWRDKKLITKRLTLGRMESSKDFKK